MSISQGNPTLSETSTDGLQVTTGDHVNDEPTLEGTRIDILALTTLACRAPAGIVAVRAERRWTTLGYGIPEHQLAGNEPLFDTIAAATTTPVEITDPSQLPINTTLRQTRPPINWAYGSAFSPNHNKQSVGVVLVLDHCVRTATPRERAALRIAIRQLSVPNKHSKAANTPATNSQGLPRSVSDRVAAQAADPRDGNAPLLRTRDVARLMKVTERTVLNWAASGKLKGFRTIGGQLRFRHDALNLIDERPG